METEVTLGADVYRIGKINAWTQFHVVRRLTPLLTAMAAAIREKKKPLLTSPDPDEAGMEKMMEGMVAMAEVLATMKDEDCDYVIRACLSVCQKKQGNMWSSMLSSDGHLMFSENTSLSNLLKLTSATLQHQEGLIDFFQNLQSPKGELGDLKLTSMKSS